MTREERRLRGKLTVYRRQVRKVIRLIRAEHPWRRQLPLFGEDVVKQWWQ